MLSVTAISRYVYCCSFSIIFAVAILNKASAAETAQTTDFIPEHSDYNGIIQAKIAEYSPASSTECDTLNQQALTNSSPQIDGANTPINNETDLTAALQSCINSLPNLSILALKPRVYPLSATVFINKSLFIKTEGFDGECGLSDTHSCAELKATENAQPFMASGLLMLNANNIVLQSIVINGNRAARLNSYVANYCAHEDNGLGHNMSVYPPAWQPIADSIFIQKISSKNAICATGLEIENVNNLVFVNNSIGLNGVHNQTGLWSDGVTIHQAKNAIIEDNDIKDNTDVDFIIGGCVNCKIRNNKISHSNSFEHSSFAAFMAFRFPGVSDGDYTGSDITNNQIDCNAKRCGVGLYLGTRMWMENLNNYSVDDISIGGGNFERNSVKNAMFGFYIDAPKEKIRIKNNSISQSGGQYLSQKGLINFPAASIADKSLITIEDDGVFQTANNYANDSFFGDIPNWPTYDSSLDSANNKISQRQTNSSTSNNVSSAVTTTENAANNSPAKHGGGAVAFEYLLLVLLLMRRLVQEK